MTAITKSRISNIGLIIQLVAVAVLAVLCWQDYHTYLKGQPYYWGMWWANVPSWKIAIEIGLFVLVFLGVFLYEWYKEKVY